MKKFGIDWHVAVRIISYSAWMSHDIDFLVHALCEYETLPQEHEFSTQINPFMQQASLVIVPF